MHEWHVEKRAFSGPIQLVEAAAIGFARHIKRLRVLREGAGVIAKQIARKLIEKDDQRERVTWMRTPDIETAINAARCSAPKRAVMAASNARSRREPLIGFRLKPEERMALSRGGACSAHIHIVGVCVYNSWLCQT